VPDGKVPAVTEVAPFAGIAVRQKQRRFISFRFDAHGVNRKNVGAIKEIGDAAKAFGLALRAIDAVRAIKAHQRLVLRWCYLGFDHKPEPLGCRRIGDHKTFRRGLIGRRRKRLSVEFDALENKPIAIENKRRRAGNATATFDRQFRNHAGAVGRQPEGKVRQRNVIIARAVVLEPEDLAGICAHFVDFPVEIPAFREN
jgi:hypothetical protein